MDDGPYWVILLIYESYDMRHTGFRRLTVVNGTPGFWGVTKVVPPISIRPVLRVFITNTNFNEKTMIEISLIFSLFQIVI